MMPKAGDVGVIVGRFQVHRLHDAHRSLIQSVLDSHHKTIVVLGLAHARGTVSNPLDFEARKAMLFEAFHFAADRLTVLYIVDDRDDVHWSQRLDAIVEATTTPTQKVTMFGGRDSFIARYHGRYPTQVLEPESYVSGTELRRSITRAVRTTEDFRAGVIWASANRYPPTHPTVDVCVFRGGHVEREVCLGCGQPTELRDCGCPAGTGYQRVPPSALEILLVRKPSEQQWRFSGGFYDPTKDQSWEAAGKREVAEETGVEVGDLHYAGSFQVDDWRYRNESEKIVTTLFVGEHVFGGPKPADDVAEARWFTVGPKGEHPLPGEIKFDAVVPEHQPLLRRALVKIGMLRGGAR